MAKMMSIVFCTALGTRIGDITRHWLDEHQFAFRCWDVTIKLVEGTHIQELTATLLIRNEKGHKGDPHKNTPSSSKSWSDLRMPFCVL